MMIASQRSLDKPLQCSDSVIIKGVQILMESPSQKQETIGDPRQFNSLIDDCFSIIFKMIRIPQPIISPLFNFRILLIFGCTRDFLKSICLWLTSVIQVFLLEEFWIVASEGWRHSPEWPSKTGNMAERGLFLKQPSRPLFEMKATIWQSHPIPLATNGPYREWC